ncbi:hypothetical protein OUZ56_000983 [Daphnia magna]|uniref:HAT C-terminal dimerisation domain-containing protein n=1 Tax=Daphnia magna TaxID=35525 RepID=A0ABR0A1A4_9CRUS|nr:hypothetical protein OUZ56_000983 [Daphnia magna]
MISEDEEVFVKESVLVVAKTVQGLLKVDPSNQAGNSTSIDFCSGTIQSSGLVENDVSQSIRSELEYRYKHLRDSQEIQEGTAGRAMNSPPSKRQTLTRALFSTVIQKRAQSASASKVLDEFELYLSEPVYQSSGPDSPDNDCPSDLRFSPLGYWKVNAHRFPLLALIARELFGVPASGGEIERVFSTATDIATAKRNRIKPPLFAKMLFIKRNMKLMSPVTPVKQK